MFVCVRMCVCVCIYIYIYIYEYAVFEHNHVMFGNRLYVCVCVRVYVHVSDSLCTFFCLSMNLCVCVFTPYIMRK